MIFCANLGKSAAGDRAMIRQVFGEESMTWKYKLG
jgi:hypothetical protein